VAVEVDKEVVVRPVAVVVVVQVHLAVPVEPITVIIVVQEVDVHAVEEWVVVLPELTELQQPVEQEATMQVL
jgi:hypothetical protein